MITYTARERAWLSVLALAGLLGLNGVFIYGVVTDPASVRDALANPVAAAFIVEALVLTGVLAYLLRRWGVTTLHWAWFVLASLIGGLAFALPVVLLMRRDGRVHRHAADP